MCDEQDNVKIEIHINNKICRCCLSNEGWRFMWERYECNDLAEVYGEMLMECFALSWNAQSHEMICKSCVQRLRKAMNLKIEFMAVQELLQEDFVEIDNKVEQETPEKPLLENGKGKPKDDPDYMNEFLETSDNASKNDTESDSETISDDQLLETKQPRGRRTYKKYSIDDLRNAKTAVREGTMTIAKAARTYGIHKKTLANSLAAHTTEKYEEKDALQERNFKLYDEIKTIIKYTNALPFKSKTAKYYCAYCSTEGPFFLCPDKLRKHTRTKHSHELATLVQEIMRPPWLNEVLKMDITDLKCTACDTLLTDWNEMFMHFAEAHSIQFDEACTRVIPYTLTNDLKCALCLESYLNFGQLDAHMNAHFCNYICYECGDTFLANSRLERHLKIHNKGKYPCDECGKVFTLELYRSKHVNLVHKQLAQVKCLYCPEKFLGSLNRHQHMLERHPKKVNVMTCEVCHKKFTWKKYYVNHVKKAHAHRYKCNKCSMSFSKKDELKHHFAKKIRMKDPDHMTL